MTHDQIREAARRVNPVPDPTILKVDVPVLTPLDWRTEMQVDDRSTEVMAGRNPWRGPLVGIAAAFVVVLASGGLYMAFSGSGEEVVDQTTVPTPTTVVEPERETLTDLEVIEAGVAALYGGDADRAVELFELRDFSDDAIRAEVAYQAAIRGRSTVDCLEREPGEFDCSTPYYNAVTDAVAYVDGGDANFIVVDDGVITDFTIPNHPFAGEMGIFLAIERRFEGYDACPSAPTPECATIELDNLDAWAEWRREPANFVEGAVELWYGGDCEGALFVGGPIGGQSVFSHRDCSASSTPAQTIEYESILGAQVSVESCETRSGSELCEVHYSNAMNSAVGKAPSVTAREFTIYSDIGTGWVRDPNAEGGRTLPWYEGVYPEDTELRESFRLFAEGGDLQDEYADAGCASARTPECATLIMDNLDDWATWHQNRP